MNKRTNRFLHENHVHACVDDGVVFVHGAVYAHILHARLHEHLFHDDSPVLGIPYRRERRSLFENDLNVYFDENPHDGEAGDAHGENARFENSNSSLDSCLDEIAYDEGGNACSPFLRQELFAAALQACRAFAQSPMLKPPPAWTSCVAVYLQLYSGDYSLARVTDASI